MIRQDNMRWVFSAALGYWANSIIVSQQDNSSTESYKQQYSSSFYSALKHVLSEWLSAREPRVRLASSEAIGYMEHIIESDQLAQHFLKILSSLLNLMKRETKNQYPVSVGLHNLVYVAVKDCTDIIPEHIENIMNHVRSYGSNNQIGRNLSKS